MEKQAWNNTEWAVETADGEPAVIHPGEVVYIAGPMTGIENWNRAEFNSAENFFTQEGIPVLNPAKLPLGMPEERYMPICLAMVGQADIVALLPGWTTSAGATVESLYAGKQGKRILFMQRITEKGGNGDGE